MNHLRDGHEYLDTMREYGRHARNAAIAFVVSALFGVGGRAEHAFRDSLEEMVFVVFQIAFSLFTIYACFRMGRARRRLEEIERDE